MRSIQSSLIDHNLEDIHSLGLDISPRNCGLSLINFRAELVDSIYLDLGELNPYNGDNERSLYLLSHKIKEICLGRKVVVSCIEDYAFNKPHRVSWNGERVGVAKLTLSCDLKSTPYIFPISPTTVKKFAGPGKGKDPTRNFCRWAKWEMKTDHQEDAAVLAMMGICLYRNFRWMNKKQRECIRDLRNKFDGYSI